MGGHSDRRLAAGLLLLTLGLILNSLLGPLLAGVVEYPLSETLTNQTIGLEAVSLLLVAPWSALAAVLVFRDHRAGPVVAMAPSGYAAYMFSQYIVGPEYLQYPRILPLHLGIFVLSWLLLLLAWNRVRIDDLPTTSRGKERALSIVLFLLAAFVLTRYVGAFQGILTGATISEEFVDDPTMYWSIFLLDLGIVFPVTVVSGLGLLRGAAWARKALYGLVGWFTLVPISVSAMSIVMLLNEDPNAATENVVVLSVAAVLFTAFAVWLFRPLFEDED